MYGFKCLSCGSNEALEVDHIKPVSSGGKTEFDNLQILCKKCNMEKGINLVDYRQHLLTTSRLKTPHDDQILWRWSNQTCKAMCD